MKTKLSVESLEMRDNPSWLSDGWSWVVDAGGVVLTTPRDIIRIPVAVGAVGSAGNLPSASILLMHSLQDNPTDMVFQNGSGLSNQIQASPEYQAALTAIKDKIKDLPPGEFHGTSGIKLESDRDLFLAIHSADITYSGVKNPDGTFTLTVNIVDTYNFESQAVNPGSYYGGYFYGNGIKGAFTTIINELAVGEELLTGIRPYKVTVVIQEK
jgi:hypothetical protein